MYAIQFGDVGPSLTFMASPLSSLLKAELNRALYNSIDDRPWSFSDSKAVSSRFGVLFTMALCK